MFTTQGENIQRPQDGVGIVVPMVSFHQESSFVSECDETMVGCIYLGSVFHERYSISGKNPDTGAIDYQFCLS